MLRSCSNGTGHGDENVDKISVSEKPWSLVSDSILLDKIREDTNFCIMTGSNEWRG